MKLFLKKNWKTITLLVLAIVFRILLSFLNPHSDLRIQSEWGKWMYVNNGPKGLYEWNVWGCIWPNHPPLISLVYFWAYKIHSFLMYIMSWMGNFIALNRLAPTKFMWFFNFIVWFGQATFETTNYLIGTMVVIKQIMIVADVIIAGIIYYICQKNKVDWKKYVFAYLLLPFSWYLSSIWGQSDQLSFLFFIIAFSLISSKKYSILAPLFFAIAGNLKPNCILLLPLFLFIWYKHKQSFIKLIVGGLGALIFSFWTISWFTDRNLLVFTFKELPKRLTTNEGLVTLNAFNFWYIFYPFPSIIGFDTTKFLMLTAKYWGVVMFFITTFLSLKVVKNKKLENIYGAIFVAGFGSWLFMTGMHERYSFLAIMALLFYSIFHKKYFKYFIILSIIYFLSMFYVFSVPQQLDGIKDIFNWNYQFVPRFLSLVNILIYGRVSYFMIKNENKKD